MTLIAFLLMTYPEKAKAEEPSKQTSTKIEHVGDAQEQKKDSLNLKESSPKKKEAESRAIEWLAKNIYHESRGQEIKGQYAVAIVTMNRVNSGKFPSTVEGVVRQPGQFSWVRNKGTNKITDNKSYAIAKEIARNVINKEGVIYKEVSFQIKGAQYFHEKRVKTSSKRRIVARIGEHIFMI